MILILPRHYFIKTKVDISAHDPFLESLSLGTLKGEKM